jgi:hypothetical protein
MSEMNPSQAISVLIQGCEIGQKAGAYSFEDAAMIHKAIKVFVKNAPETAEQKAEAPEAPETPETQQQN